MKLIARANVLEAEGRLNEAVDTLREISHIVREVMSGPYVDVESERVSLLALRHKEVLDSIARIQEWINKPELALESFASQMITVCRTIDTLAIHGDYDTALQLVDLILRDLKRVSSLMHPDLLRATRESLIALKESIQDAQRGTRESNGESIDARLVELYEEAEQLLADRKFDKYVQLHRGQIIPLAILSEEWRKITTAFHKLAIGNMERGDYEEARRNIQAVRNVIQSFGSPNGSEQVEVELRVLEGKIHEQEGRSEHF